jgi:hypothetical protein
MAYDLFQGRPDSDVLWKGFVETAEEAKAKLEAFSKSSPDPYFAKDLSNNEFLYHVSPAASALNERKGED